MQNLDGLRMYTVGIGLEGPSTRLSCYLVKASLMGELESSRVDDSQAHSRLQTRERATELKYGVRRSACSERYPILQAARINQHIEHLDVHTRR